MDLYQDKTEQRDLNNLITSVTDRNIHDGQKRYKTLGKAPDSNYPRPKTMFYVKFNCKEGESEYSEDLSKYLIEVTKPNVTINSTKMNQYNRIKYVIDSVDYTDLRLTFMDVKDDPIENAFFTYLQSILIDFNKKENSFQNPDKIREFGKENWGLTIESNDKKIISIDIAEMFMNKLFIYTIQNPVLSSIDFGSNKIGDYSPNQIIVTFKVEGLTKKYSGKIDEKQAHEFQKRWDRNSITWNTGVPNGSNEYLFDTREAEKIKQNWVTYQNYNDQVDKTINTLGDVFERLELDRALESIEDYLSYPNKGDYFWVKGSGNTSYGLRTPRNRTFFMSGLNKVPNFFDF